MQLNDIYKCSVCGNIVQLIHVGGGNLSCCEKAMQKLEEQTADSSTEKHVPIINKVENGYEVVVGSTLHPMTEEHHIEWIELIADGKSYRQYLKPGDQPKAFFQLEKAEKLIAREYCNIHGLWRGE
ncbi:MAG: desulfoferrodoxin [Gammaproteobacteria bacterium]|nr:desulfoferrodoxin [Gammaproteobacteria bacterium]